MLQTGTALLAAGCVDWATVGRAWAQTTLTPNGALAKLPEGNRRFVAKDLRSDAEDLAILKQQPAEKQEPFAVVLSCADSRVPVEIIFDQSIGHIFATRVAGNIVTPEIIASIEYGAAVLGIKVILVIGHANCGAPKAAIQGKEAPGQISTPYQYLRPAVDQAGSDVEAAIKANAKHQSELLRKASTVIAGLVSDKKIRVAAGYYDIVRGGMTLSD